MNYSIQHCILAFNIIFTSITNISLFYQQYRGFGIQHKFLVIFVMSQIN